MSDPIIIKLESRDNKFTFYDFTSARSESVFESAVDKLNPFFDRIPEDRLRDVAGAKIFVVNRLPGGRRTGGGYYTPEEYHVVWTGRLGRTGVEDDWVVEGKHPDGLIGITNSRFPETEEEMRTSLYHYTVMHEFAHLLDQKHDLSDGLTVEDLRGVRYADNSNAKEMFAEAYARWTIHPDRICRRGEYDVEGAAACHSRLRTLIEGL